MRSVDDWLAASRREPGHFAALAHRLTAAWPTGALDIAAPPREAPTAPWPKSQGTTADRRTAETTARAFMSAFITGEPLEQLANTVWIARAGQLVTVDKEPLLIARPGADRVRGRLSRIVSYDLAALRQCLPGGVAHALAARIPLNDARIVCGQVAIGGEQGRFSLIVGRHADGWEVRSLPLPPVDFALVESVRASTDERDAVRIAHRVVFSAVLGQRGTIVGLRNVMMDELQTGRGPISPEQFATEVGDGAPFFDRLYAVVGPTTSVANHNVPSAADTLVQACRDRWRAARQDFLPQWTRTSVGRWTDGAVQPGAPWFSLFLEIKDRRGPPRRSTRLAGLLHAAESAG